MLCGYAELSAQSECYICSTGRRDINDSIYRHLTILFDNEAKALGSAPSPSERDGSFTDHGLLIDEMNYDAEVINLACVQNTLISLTSR